LIVEVDGSIHEYSAEQDTLREQLLTSLGLRMLRFTNEQVLDSLDAIIEEIVEELGNATPHPASSCGHNPTPTPHPRARGGGRGEG